MHVGYITEIQELVHGRVVRGDGKQQRLIWNLDGTLDNSDGIWQPQVANDFSIKQPDWPHECMWVKYPFNKPKGETVIISIGLLTQVATWVDDTLYSFDEHHERYDVIDDCWFLINVPQIPKDYLD